MYVSPVFLQKELEQLHIIGPPCIVIYLRLSHPSIADENSFLTPVGIISSLIFVFLNVPIKLLCSLSLSLI